MTWRRFWFTVLAAATGCVLALILAGLGLWLVAKAVGA
jgi:hypothetical protein